MGINNNDRKSLFNENKNNNFERIKINGLEIIIADDYEQMSQFGADQIFNNLKNKEDLLICTATGSTPTRAYDLLAAKFDSNPEVFDKIRMIKLDEGGGIPGDDTATCETYLQKHLVAPLNIDSDRFISFESNPDNPEQEIKQVAKKLDQEGDIDLCILGMGVNGHLGFNEPASFLKPNAHVAELADTTKKHTMAQEAQHEIKYGLTLGMSDIMRSKKIILLVNGEHKQESFRQFLSGKITSQFPASMLCMHPNVTVFCDREAVPDISKLKKRN